MLTRSPKTSVASVARVLNVELPSNPRAEPTPAFRAAVHLPCRVFAPRERVNGRWHAGCRTSVMQETKAGEVHDAELEVARTKQLFQESLQLAGETSTRLAAEMRKKATPALIAVVVGGAVLAGAAFVVARSEPRARWRSPRPSPTGILARAIGAWLLRAAALRVAEALSAKLRNSSPPALAAQSELA
jgi:hypothetical protein